MRDCLGDKLKVMSISPETDNILPVIEKLREDASVPFITHTKADAAQTEAAVEAGARHGTHFYDVFYVPDETDLGVRPVGAVEVLLADPRCTVDFICDGAHVAPRSSFAWPWRAKGYENVIAITDSNIGAGLPEGIHDTPWGYPVRHRAEQRGPHPRPPTIATTVASPAANSPWTGPSTTSVAGSIFPSIKSGPWRPGIRHGYWGWRIKG